MSSSLRTVFALMWLVSLCCGFPQKKTEDRIDRPPTPEPPPVSQCGLDSLLADVFGTSGNSDCGGNTGGGGSSNNSPSDNGSSNPSEPYQPNPNPSSNSYPESSSYEPDIANEPSPSQPAYVNNNGEGQGGQGGQGACQCVQYYLCHDNNTINDNGIGLIDIRLKDEECDNYLMKCCGQEGIVDHPTTQKPFVRQSKCGQRNVEGIGFRITGNNDNEAQYGEFPWMVAVIRPDETLSQNGKTVSVYQCGGSLIHPQVVLTGAHCVKGKHGLIVRAGEWDTQTKNELYPTQDRSVKEIIVHEQFHNGTLANDPALLILESPVDMTVENVGLVCLPQAGETMDHRSCVASGWGKDLFGKEGKYQVILKRIDLPVVPRGSCQQSLRTTRLGQHFNLHESFICAGGIKGKDTCKGDGGSPLVCPSKDNPQVYVQAGIVAWGIDCGTEVPGVYVNVPAFVNWIHNKLQAHGISLDGE